SAEANRHCALCLTACRKYRYVAAHNRRRNRMAFNALARPELMACRRVIRDDGFRPADYKLRALGRLNQHRSRPARVIIARSLPHLLSGLFVERSYVRRITHILIGGHYHQTFVKHGRRTRPHSELRNPAERLLPDEFPAEVVAVKPL